MENLFLEIEKPTEEKIPGAVGDSFKDDFEPEAHEYTDHKLFIQNGGGAFINEPGQPAPGMQPVIEPVKQSYTFTASESAEIGLSLFDAAQSSLFVTLHARKLRKKIFADEKEYAQALATQYLTAAQLENDPHKTELQSKAKFYSKKLNEKTSDIQFTPEEEARIKPPLSKLMERYNMDLPPGLALALVMTEVMSKRVIGLIGE
jgi:hypothetical protein